MSQADSETGSWFSQLWSESKEWDEEIAMLRTGLTPTPCLQSSCLSSPPPSGVRKERITPALHSQLESNLLQNMNQH